MLKKAKVMILAERSWLKFEDVSELGQWVGGKADGGQERLRWGVAHILQSYVAEVPLPGI